VNTGVSPEIMQFVASFGAFGVAMLWLWDLRAQLDKEKERHESTRQKLYEALKDCNREDETKRFPMTMRERINKPTDTPT
jgi:hypothetical protein